MNYRIYRLEFRHGVHFGMGALDQTGYAIGADTLFSALCLEALKGEEGLFDDFLRAVREGKLLWSDTFPFINEEYYLPKPMITIKSEKSGDSSEKKKFKKLQYIPLSYWKDYVNGTFPLEHADDLKHLGTRTMKVSAAVRGQDETLPYRVEVYQFKENGGLYFVLGYENEEEKMLFDDLIEALSLSGLGGKRSSGLGSFSCSIKKVPSLLQEMLQKENGRLMTLSVSLPRPDEMEKALENADYQLLRRGGFVYSDTYAQEQTRKKDLYVFAAGSVFANRFTGDVYDVSNGGHHAVYRYAKPLFLGVSE